ncbi:MAG: 5-(carboxyamino)imidazole ribonucleotide mutase [bacterium]|nr:5-(carboxyamino)imidazole ribonucleotide mutase [bacterium]
MSERVLVGILMGSDSDLRVMAEAAATLDEFGVPHETVIASAHRVPERVRHYAIDAPRRGIEVLIAGAGQAAHLAGVLAAHVTLPVIGVPLSGGRGGVMGGIDALLATVQMPPGIPVATVAVDGARNAALLAVSILAAAHPERELYAKLARYREQMGQAVDEKNARLQQLGPRGYQGS